MSRAERVDAASDAIAALIESGPLRYIEEAAAALAASDALLRTDEAQCYAISALRSHIEDLTPAEAETIIKDITAALLGEGE